MQRALDLAKQGQGRVEPNPMVGCVIVRDGGLVAEGFHRAFGGPHAEAAALASLKSPGDAKNATAYVTLEPCCHQGKTPPCSQALIAAGVSRVVVATEDPFPQVNGGGLSQLADAGIETTVGVLRSDAQALLAPYLKKTRTGLPWVIAKWAMTLDGRIATVAGQSQWITSPPSRAEVHQLRSRVDAVAVGMGTVVADDPSLNARLPDGQAALRTATRLVYCRNRVPDLQSKLIQSAADHPLLLVANDSISKSQLQPLIDADAEVLTIGAGSAVEMVEKSLSELGDRGMTNVMVEGGGELLASFFEAGQIDECHIYLGAKIVGGSSAAGPIGGHGISEMANAVEMEMVEITPLGSDLRAVYRKKAN
ncbi:MAG: bifunctional diaminohydroxyphosphoribosylaminopyrimidine deaminase/5-amino-6-(5-phosphoribosylamino)uracil reductase RibD [Rubripirellula sp.]